MSSVWLKNFVLAAVLAMMPLQGIAATLSVLLCHGDAHAHTIPMDGGHDHDAHHDGHHNTQQDEGSTGNPAAIHLCCNVTVSAPPVLTLPAASPDSLVRPLTPDPLHDLFVPDRPQRPPLA